MTSLERFAHAVRGEAPSRSTRWRSALTTEAVLTPAPLALAVLTLLAAEAARDVLPADRADIARATAAAVLRRARRGRPALTASSRHGRARLVRRAPHARASAESARVLRGADQARAV